MARKKRVWYSGAVYHVMSRGNRRGTLFRDEDDYLSFLEFLTYAQGEYRFKIHALCLMTNHFHMLIETGDTELAKIMQKFLLGYAMTFNAKYNLSGHVFEKRYTDRLIEDDRYFLEVSRYIHLNPVEAGMAREALAYEYSSYRNYLRDDPNESNKTSKIEKLMDELVVKERTLSFFRNHSKEEYRMFVEGKISHEEHEMLIRKDMGEDDHWLPWEKTKQGKGKTAK